MACVLVGALPSLPEHAGHGDLQSPRPHHTRPPCPEPSPVPDLPSAGTAQGHSQPPGPNHRLTSRSSSWISPTVNTGPDVAVAQPFAPRPRTSNRGPSMTTKGTAQIAVEISFKEFEGSGEGAKGGISDPFGVCGWRGALRKGHSSIVFRTYGPRKSEHSIVNYAPR